MTDFKLLLTTDYARKLPRADYYAAKRYLRQCERVLKGLPVNPMERTNGRKNKARP